MSVWSERVTWWSQKKTVAQIARDTGAPYRTLLAIRRGSINPSAALLQDLNRAYRAETYARLRAVGVPTFQAQALRGAAVGRVAQLESEADWLAHEWATGTMMMKYKTDIDRDSLSGKYKTEYQKYYERAIQGIGESFKTVEEQWRDKHS